MPTYQINSTLIFTPAQKASVAEQITNAHCTLTGADRVAVQVIFRQLAAEDHYHGGARTADAVGTLVWVHAICKAGRSQGLKDEIMSKVCEVIVGELGVHKRQVLLYMQELDIGNALQSFDDQCLVKKD